MVSFALNREQVVQLCNLNHGSKSKQTFPILRLHPPKPCKMYKSLQLMQFAVRFIPEQSINFTRFSIRVLYIIIVEYKDEISVLDKLE